MNKKYKNSVQITEDRVVKKRNNDLLELYEYLDTVRFDNYPEILDINDREVTTKYIKETKYHEVSKGTELMKTLSMLHYKTMFFKDVSKNKYKDIYNKLLSNIEYLTNYYEEAIEEIENEEYMSPSHYLFARNYSAIDGSLKYAKEELKKWFKIVEFKSKERVCINHNNISLEHFIHGDKNYLISWDNYLVDTPVLDLYKLYKKEGYKLDFSYLLKVYNETLLLTEEEKMLFNILISIPPKIIKIDDEMSNTYNIKNTYSYIYSSMGIVSQNK